MKVRPGSTTVADCAGARVTRRAMLAALSAGVALRFDRPAIAAQPQAGARRAVHAGAARGRRFTRLWMDVARTGTGYEAFLARRQAIRASGKPELLSYESGAFTSLEQMR